MGQVLVASPDTTRADASRRFVLAIAAVTFLPWLFLPRFGLAGAGSTTDVQMFIFLSGAPHVLSTFALYFDRDMRPLFLAKRDRFVVLPIVLLITMPIGFSLLSDRVISLFLMVGAGWAAFHFSRQNLGVLSFVYAARDQASPTRWERQLLTATGIVAAMGVMGASTDLDRGGLLALRVPLRLWAAVAMIGIVVAAAPVLWRIRRDAVSRLFFVQAILFFAPFLLVGPGLAVPYNVVHGFQYLVFMGYLVGHRGDPGGVAGRRLLLAALGFALVGGLAYQVVRDVPAAPLLGALLAANVLHFVMDASIWRLREPIQRRYVTERFPFLARVPA